MTLSLNRAKFVCFFSLLLALSLALVGCASVPSGTTGPVVAGKILSRADLGVYGGSRSVNPFIAQSALLLGSPDEFVVFELDLTLPQAARILIDGSVTDASGAEVAMLYSPQEMHRYWEIRPTRAIMMPHPAGNARALLCSVIFLRSACGSLRGRAGLCRQEPDSPARNRHRVGHDQHRRAAGPHVPVASREKIGWDIARTS